MGVDIGNSEKAYLRMIGMEKPAEARSEIIYHFPKNADVTAPTLWVEKITQDKDFKPWFYTTGKEKGNPTRVTIPGTRERAFIHFLPPDAQVLVDEKARKQQTEEIGSGSDEDKRAWFDRPDYQEKKLQVIRDNVAAFTDLLLAIKNGELEGTQYLVGITNPPQARFALSLGFRLCTEEGYQLPDLTRPIEEDQRVIDDMEHKVGISVAELSEMYQLQTNTPDVSFVQKRRRELKLERKQQVDSL